MCIRDSTQAIMHTYIMLEPQTEESFDESKVSDLLTRMETNWASYIGQNQQFWSHEWSKHGTCSTPFLGNQHDYFSNALDARVKTMLLTMLSRSNIVPDSTKTYTSADISSAVGHAPALGCKGSKLSEIAVCLSKDDLSRQDCDPSVLSPTEESSMIVLRLVSLFPRVPHHHPLRVVNVLIMVVEVFMIQQDHVNVRPPVALTMIVVLITTQCAEEEATLHVSRASTVRAARPIRSV